MGGDLHSLRLKADGSIVPWEGNRVGQSDVPPPNIGFAAVAVGAGRDWFETVLSGG